VNLTAPPARRTPNVDHPAEDVSTDVVDLTHTSFENLKGYDDAIFAASLARFLRQIERPRSNVGSGQPGRID
jgi:hypothetical protein